MPLTYGVTDQGFVAKPATQVAAEIDAALQLILGASAGTEPDGTIPAASWAGQQKALLVDGFAAMWDLAQAIYSAFDPDQATGQSLDALCAQTGTIREGAEFSTVLGTCTGVPGTQLAPGRVGTTTDTGARFDTQASTSDPNAPSSTIASVPAWVHNTMYPTIGQRVTNVGNIYQLTVPGTSGNTGGPTGTSTSITEGTCTWTFVGVGTGAVDVEFVAEVAGPIGAAAGLLSVIATPVSGWQTLVNLVDATPGQTQESDAALRVRREQELSAAGNTTLDAIRARVLEVNQGSTDPNHLPPTSVTVFGNDTDSTNSDGMPPHSVEVLVLGGTDQDIAQAVWNAVGGGINAVGNQTNTVTDSQGNSQTIHWSRPTQVPIYVALTILFDKTQWPTGMPSPYTPVIEAALSAMLTFGGTYPVGESVRSSPLGSAIMRGPSAVDSTGVFINPAPPQSPPAPGILEVRNGADADGSQPYIGTAPAPVVSTAIAITSRQLAVFDSSRCTFTAIPETP